MASKKTAVIDYLFSLHWDDAALRRSVMTFEDVRDAILHIYGDKGKKALSADNVANFIKDLLRKDTANKNWPARITALRITASQRVGEGAIFEFIPFLEGQTEPFPDKYLPTPETPRRELQSLSLSYPARQFGRRDETWLIQTAVQLHLIETHLALSSRHHLTDLSHLQIGVKLRRTEIDALFLGHRLIGSERSPVLVTSEAKQLKERLTEAQVVQQAVAAFDQSACDLVIPMAIRVLKDGVYVLEFEAVRREQAASLTEVQVASDALYTLKPSVPGITG
jgi:hypothetical protein